MGLFFYSPRGIRAAASNAAVEIGIYGEYGLGDLNLIIRYQKNLRRVRESPEDVAAKLTADQLIAKHSDRWGNRAVGSIRPKL